MIAPVGAGSAAQLAALHARAFDPPWSASEIGKLLENSAAFAVLSSASAEAPQGFVMAWAAGGDSEILTLAVTPEARRKGVGHALVTAAMVAALVRGAASMTLDVAEDNAPARALYEKLGFIEVGRRRRYYSRDNGRIDALTLRRTLPRPLI